MRVIRNSRTPNKNSATIDARVERPRKTMTRATASEEAGKKVSIAKQKKYTRTNSRSSRLRSYSEDSLSRGSSPRRRSHTERRNPRVRHPNRSSKSRYDYRDDYTTVTPSEAVSHAMSSYSTDTEANSESKLNDNGLVFNASDFSDCWSKVSIDSDEEGAFQNFTKKYEGKEKQAKRGLFSFGADDEVSLPSITTRSYYTQGSYVPSYQMSYGSTVCRSFESKTTATADERTMRSFDSDESDDDTIGRVERTETYQTELIQESNGWICGLDDDSIANGSYGGLRNNEILVAAGGMRSMGTIKTFEATESNMFGNFDEEDSVETIEASDKVTDVNPKESTKIEVKEPLAHDKNEENNEDTVGSSFFSLEYWYGKKPEGPVEPQKEDRDKNEESSQERIDNARRDLLTPPHLVVQSAYGSDGQIVDLHARVRKTEPIMKVSPPSMKIDLNGRVKHFQNIEGDTLGIPAKTNAFVEKASTMLKPYPHKQLESLAESIERKCEIESNAEAAMSRVIASKGNNPSLEKTSTKPLLPRRSSKQGTLNTSRSDESKKEVAASALIPKSKNVADSKKYSKFLVKPTTQPLLPRRSSKQGTLNTSRSDESEKDSVVSGLTPISKKAFPPPSPPRAKNKYNEKVSPKVSVNTSFIKTCQEVKVEQKRVSEDLSKHRSQVKNTMYEKEKDNAKNNMDDIVFYSVWSASASASVSPSVCSQSVQSEQLQNSNINRLIRTYENASPRSSLKKGPDMQNPQNVKSLVDSYETHLSGKQQEDKSKATTNYTPSSRLKGYTDASLEESSLSSNETFGELNPLDSEDEYPDSFTIDELVEDVVAPDDSKATISKEEDESISSWRISVD
jgi:hypothetical protein